MTPALLSPGEGGPFPLSAFRIPNSHPSASVNVNEPAPPSPISHLPSSRKRGPAFSLVELLAVVGIIVMISVAAVPVMRGLGGSQSSRATAQILVSALEQARTAAILTGTNVYLVILNPNNAATWPRNYGVVRPSVDQDGDRRDDFQTNVPFSTNNWVLLSKWEQLPGDLVFGTNRLGQLPSVSAQGLALPPGTSIRCGIGFLPSGGLETEAATNGLLFASSNRVSGNTALVADRIEVSFYSGRVRYAGITNNVDF